MHTWPFLTNINIQLHHLGDIPMPPETIYFLQSWYTNATWNHIFSTFLIYQFHMKPYIFYNPDIPMPHEIIYFRQSWYTNATWNHIFSTILTAFLSGCMFPGQYPQPLTDYNTYWFQHLVFFLHTPNGQGTLRGNVTVTSVSTIKYYSDSVNTISPNHQKRHSSIPPININLMMDVLRFYLLLYSIALKTLWFHLLNYNHAYRQCQCLSCNRHRKQHHKSLHRNVSIPYCLQPPADDLSISFFFSCLEDDVNIIIASIVNKMRIKNIETFATL